MALRGEVGVLQNRVARCGVSVTQVGKKKAIMHERPGKTMSEELPNQTFQTESGMISRTGEPGIVWKRERTREPALGHQWPGSASHLCR